MSEGEVARSVDAAAPEPAVRTLSDSRKTTLRKVLELPLLLGLAILVAVIIKTFLLQAFYIPSGSMIPTLRVGDRVLVEKLSYRFHDVQRGDVIVFQRPDGSGLPQQADLPWYEDARNFVLGLVGLPTAGDTDYIKRVVAVGGDRLRYAGTPRKLYVNDKVVPQPFILHGVDRSSPAVVARDCDHLGMKAQGKDCVVPAGKLFVMGDHRGNSEDSRFIGPIGDKSVVGRAFTVLWPPGDFKGL